MLIFDYLYASLRLYRSDPVFPSRLVRLSRFLLFHLPSFSCRLDSHLATFVFLALFSHSSLAIFHSCPSLIRPGRTSTTTHPTHSAPFFFPNPGNRLQIPASTTNIANTIGISTQTPLACAIAPTANGKIVAPAAPNAAANPMPPTCRCLGRSFVAATTAAGKRGPIKKPSMAMPVAETGKFGTSQKRRWAAMARKR